VTVDEFLRHEAQKTGAALMQIDLLRDRLKAIGVSKQVIDFVENSAPVEAVGLMRTIAVLPPSGVRHLNEYALKDWRSQEGTFVT